MIPIKSNADLALLREGGKILAEVHHIVGQNIRVGMSAAQLDKIAYDAILSYDAAPSFLGYSGYKYTTCISRNEEVVHGIPYESKIVLPGDIWSVDIGVYYKGFHTDAARTHCIEVVDAKVLKLVEVTQNSFFESVKMLKPGVRLGEMSFAMQRYVESFGFSVVRDLYSHGVGKDLHEEPLIPNFGPRRSGPTLKEGMVFAIEPMVNIGHHDVLTLDDNWTIIAADRSWSAHYENTIAITSNGVEILTLGEK